jgi:hypothetical protein
VEVTKSRSLLTLINGQPEEWRPDRSAACNAEIGEVSALGSTWWTFNMEAYGEEAITNLEKGWEYIQSVGLSEDLFSDDFRKSYPEWLQELKNEE